MRRTDFTNWDQELSGFPHPTLLQTSTWASVKQRYGWESIPLKWQDADMKTVAMASVLKRRIQFRGITLPVSLIYIPKGPILDWENEVFVEKALSDLIHFARRENAFLIKIEPEIPQFYIPYTNEDDQAISYKPIVNPEFLTSRGWVFSENQIQFRNTVHIDLAQDEDQILVNMKQKTRYNIRLAERKGVTVKEGSTEDFDLIFKMYAETSIRDGFTIRSRDYYLTVWKSFYQQGQLFPLIAYYKDQPLAALMLFYFQNTAYYIYGMSTNQHRNLMPTYLLQWEAIKKAKNLGCQVYDLWGAPNQITEEDPMWGVYRFKLGLGGSTIGTIGAWDYILQPFTYNVYSKIMPRILAILRKRGDAATADAL